MRPVSLYAIPVWSSTRIQNFDKLETVENKCLRRIYDYNTTDISNHDLREKARLTRLFHIIFKRTKNFYEYEIKQLEYK